MAEDIEVTEEEIAENGHNPMLEMARKVLMASIGAVAGGPVPGGGEGWCTDLPLGSVVEAVRPESGTGAERSQPNTDVLEHTRRHHFESASEV